MNRKEQAKYGLYTKGKSLFDNMTGRFYKITETENYIDVNLTGMLEADKLTAEQINYVKSFYNIQSEEHTVINSNCLRYKLRQGHQT